MSAPTMTRQELLVFQACLKQVQSQHEIRVETLPHQLKNHPEIDIQDVLTQFELHDLISPKDEQDPPTRYSFTQAGTSLALRLIRQARQMAQAREAARQKLQTKAEPAAAVVSQQAKEATPPVRPRPETARMKPAGTEKAHGPSTQPEDKAVPEAASAVQSNRPEEARPTAVSAEPKRSAPVAAAVEKHSAAVKPERDPILDADFTNIIVVTSGKGGVGKTTSSASLAAGLAQHGKKVAVLDFDVGLRKLDLAMGCERRVIHDFIDVIEGTARLEDALLQDKRLPNLYVLPTSQTQDKDALTLEGVARVLKALTDAGFDHVICDSPAGIEKGARAAMYFADEAIVVANPEVSSVRDSDRVLGLLASQTRKAQRGESGGVRLHLLLNRYNPTRVAAGAMLSVTDVESILGLDALGVIPESDTVLTASNGGTPAILYADSDVGQAYSDAVARLMGEKRAWRFIQPPKRPGLLRRMLRRR